MLYRTHSPSFLPFNPFLSSSSSLTSIIPSPSRTATTTASSTTVVDAAADAPLSAEVETEMECVVSLKGGCFRPETMGFGIKQLPFHQQQLLGEDIWAVNGQQNGGTGDDFFVDQLLNLNNEEIADEGLAVGELEQEHKDNNNSTFLCPPREQQQTEKRETLKDDFGSVLSVPADEADLEWLSHFVEDSFSQFSTPYPPGAFFCKNRKDPEPELTAQTNCFTTPVLTKARRSRRARSGGRLWSFGSSSLSIEPTTTTSSSSSTSSSPPSPSCTPLLFSSYVHPNPEPAAKKQKKGRTVGEGGPKSSGTQLPRRCSHCGVQKTPQWRAGPMGAKTLCNACGVRYKSGRLLPEYRPACSPTFSSEIHSNNHRKVLEMRRNKELGMVVARADSGLAPPPVPSFG
ncbi:hypothetical protein Ancab_026555 [Ancistrocladus abbreviatus]